MPAIADRGTEHIDAFLNEVNAEYARDPLEFHRGFEPTKCVTGRAFLDLPHDEQIRFVRAIVPWQVARIGERNACASMELTALLSALLRKKLPFTADDLEFLVLAAANVEHGGWWSAVSPQNILRAVETFAAANDMPEGLARALERLGDQLRRHDYYAESRKLLQRVEALLQPPSVARFALTTDECWTRSLNQSLAKLDSATRFHWDALLIHCGSASSSKPSKKWQVQGTALIAKIGPEPFAATQRAMFAEVGKPGGQRGPHVNALGFEADPTQVHDKHADLLRGLVWCAGLLDSDDLTTPIGDMAEICFKKLPGIGPRAPKIGNACLWALSQRSTPSAIAQLSRLKARSKHASTQTQLAKALNVAADKTGLTADNLEEIAVPSCGLSEVGELRRTLGDCSVHLRIGDDLQCETTWTTGAGKSLKSPPAAIKAEFATDVKQLNAIEKEIKSVLPGQRDRLERLYVRERSWLLPEFRKRFLDHPLVGFLARRLIWRFGGVAGIWRDGAIVDAAGRPIERLSDATNVSLWHPLGAPVSDVLAWRSWLEAKRVRQPFKQAHREIYVLTNAERETGVYSNRFAAHIVKQHQFAALCHQRGWRYTLQGEWDSHNTPTLDLPQHGLRAAFWVEPIRDAADDDQRQDVTHHMVFTHLATDQVRFSRLEGDLPVPLADVPPLVFSEVMRNVDLFVGVASIGNTPNWTDSGPLGMFHEYWHSFAFGDLLPSAEARRELLQSIVPRLKIADRCSFANRFLVVRGDLRTYKIHLGSGNILMSPNDQYLCIVPRQGAAPVGKDVFLPFDGDALVSVILSKAFLLADDSKVTDPTIARQIQSL